jgi:hypothetical protein
MPPFSYRNLPTYVQMQQVNRRIAAPEMDALIGTVVVYYVADNFHPFDAFADDKLLRKA